MYLLNALFFCVSDYFHGKQLFLFQIRSSLIIFLFLKAKLSIFPQGLIFVDKLPQQFKIVKAKNSFKFFDKDTRI